MAAVFSLAATVSCTGETSKGQTACPEYAVCFFSDGGFWVQGDTHVHTSLSNDADPESTPELIKETALARGMDFIILTDHSNSTGSFELCGTEENPTTCVEIPERFNLGPEFAWWGRAIELSEPGRFLMTCGNEISPLGEDLSPVGHVGVYPFGRENFQWEGAIVDRPPGAVKGGAGIDDAHRRGGFAVVNHPFSPGGFPPWTEYDWTSFEYDGMEIYNGGAGYDAGDERAVEAWLCDLAQGRRVTPVGASDNHRTGIEPPGNILNPPLGAALTSAYVSEMTWTAIEEAFRSGRTIAHDGENLIDFRAYGGDQDGAMPGDELRARPGDRIRIRYRGQSEEPGEVAFYLVRHGSCDDRRGQGGADFSMAKERLHGAGIPGPNVSGVAAEPFSGDFEFAYGGSGPAYVYAQFERETALVGSSGIAITSVLVLVDGASSSR